VKGLVLSAYGGSGRLAVIPRMWLMNLACSVRTSFELYATSNTSQISEDCLAGCYAVTWCSWCNIPQHIWGTCEISRVPSPAPKLLLLHKSISTTCDYQATPRIGQVSKQTMLVTNRRALTVEKYKQEVERLQNDLGNTEGPVP
jgi:hypothetical protein